MPLNTLNPGPAVDVLHGVTVIDPYRWLEDRQNPAVQEWILRHNDIHDRYFANMPGLDLLQARVAKHLNVQVVDQFAEVGTFQFSRRREKNEEQGRIYAKDISTGTERILVDLSAQGPFASAGIHQISKDGSLLAYEVRFGGGDTKQISILNVVSGEKLPDQLPKGYARGFAFASNLSGFYYSHEISGDTEGHAVRFHRFGESLHQDRVVFSMPRDSSSALALLADDENLGMIYRHSDGAETVADFYLSPRIRDTEVHLIFEGKPKSYIPYLTQGRIFVITNDSPIHNRIVEFTRSGTVAREIVPVGPSDIQQFAFVGDGVYVRYLFQRQSSIRGWTLTGDSLGNIDLPVHCSARLLPAFRSRTNSVFYSIESFSEPPTILQYMAGTDESLQWSEGAFPRNPKNTEIREVSYRSKDGMQIPMLLVSRSILPPARPQAVIMTSYGGFGVSVAPQFSVLVSIMLDLGAVFALPSIRGGSEFGKSWHEAARGRSRQTAIDDFIAAAKWLQTERITTPEQLAIFGGSNSGLLVAAAMTQSPDLFRCVLCIAPLLDMVRYEQFDDSSKWRHEYGTSKDRQDFHALYSYSPYHNVKVDENYPSAMFVTGDQDDRCNPAHVRKMVARLEDCDVRTNPLLVDYSLERGHSPVLPLSIRLEALARRLAFLCRALGMVIPEEVDDGSDRY
jgi:prolyl oligopeptidase